MRIKDGFVLKQIAGEYLAIPFDDKYEALGAVVSLNNTGAFLWDLLEAENSADALSEALMQEYQIERSLADEAVNGFLETLREKDLLIESVDCN